MEGNPQTEKGLFGTGSEAEGSYGGNSCENLAGIDDDMTSSPSNISKVQQGLLTNALQENIIQNVPVEILAIIFGFVHEVIFAPKVEEYLDIIVPQAQYNQPRQSPPLLVGAVCKRWRDITLTTPQLWTNLTINLLKPSDGQLEMTNAWAARSSHQPLDITVFMKPRNSESIQTPDKFRALFSALRSLAVRWNDIALRIPGSFRHLLLSNLEEAPPISSFYLPYNYVHDVDDWTPITLQHPLRPRRFVSFNISGMQIPFEWDRLVFLQLEVADFGEILHIIRHAQNLTHCIAGDTDNVNQGHFPITLSPIINRSLICLQTSCEIIGHLTLPSLLCLDYTASNFDEYSDIYEFMHRSRPSLNDFILRCYVDPMDLSTLPPFQRLSGLNSLSLHIDTLRPTAPDATDSFIKTLTQFLADPTILPRLKTFLLTIPSLPKSSWALFGRLFTQHAQEIQADSVPPSATPVRRPLPSVSIWLSFNANVVMDEKTFLCLSQARKSGMDLSILDYRRRDVLNDMARLYDTGS